MVMESNDKKNLLETCIILNIELSNAFAFFTIHSLREASWCMGEASWCTGSKEAKKVLPRKPLGIVRPGQKTWIHGRTP
jgi:hypothetical protein